MGENKAGWTLPDFCNYVDMASGDDVFVDVFNTGGSWSANWDGVRIRHIPSGVGASCSYFKGVHRNAACCRAMLAILLYFISKPRVLSKPRFVFCRGDWYMLTVPGTDVAPIRYCGKLGNLK